MTNEEVKDELYRMLSDVVSGCPVRNNAQKDRYREAVGVAIRSLEAWNDIPISRERKAYLLDIINKYLKEVEE